MKVDEEHALETYKSLIIIGTEAFKALQYLNGGAIVALLAYLGPLQNACNSAIELKPSLVLFIVGLTVATLAFAPAYFTQYALFNETQDRKGSHQRWQWVTVFVSLLSLLASPCI